MVAATENEVALQLDAPFDALEACLEDRVDLAALDEALRSMRGSEVASALRELHSKVVTLVLHGGELSGDEGLLVLDPSREGFDEAPANVLLEAGARPRG